MPSLGWKKPPKQAQEQSRVRAEAKGWEVGPGPRVAADEEAGLSGAHSLCGGRGQRAEGRGKVRATSFLEGAKPRRPLSPASVTTARSPCPVAGVLGGPGGHAHLLDVLQGPVVLGFRLLDLQQTAASLVVLRHAHFLEGAQEVSQDPAMPSTCCPPGLGRGVTECEGGRVGDKRPFPSFLQTGRLRHRGGDVV